MAHVGVSVDDETKAEWSKHVEESDFGSMSELIRTAVRKEIQRSGDRDGGSVPRELEKDVSRVAETQTTLQEQMEELAESFEEVADTAVQSQYPEGVIELAHDIAGDIEEIGAYQFQRGKEEKIRELQNYHKKHPENPSLGEIDQALQYLDDNLSYVRTMPLAPSDLYRVRGEVEEVTSKDDV